MKRIREFVAALQFLSALPVSKKKPSWENVISGLWAFPFIGLFIGTILSLASIPLFAFFPPAVAGAILLVVCVWITGALHIDGFIDCCDGLLAPRSKEERLVIMKDVSAGSFGVTGAVLLFIVKYACITSIPAGVLLAVLPLSAMTGRSAMIYAMYRFPYARKEGMGKLFKDSVGLRHILICSTVQIVAIAVTILFFGRFYIGIAATFFTVIFIELFGAWVLKRIPGFTGDVYGAVCELAETITLITATVVLKWST
jgi:adenosylcobinamide-GDP ribazoletransferase